MTKNQYIKVIEQVINSPRSNSQKISRLQEAFELYNREIIDEFYGFAEDLKHEENVGFIHKCIDVMERQYE